MQFVTRTVCFAFIIGSIVSASDQPEKSKLQEEFTADPKVQSKRGADDSRQVNANLNSGFSPSQSTITNLPQFYGGHFAQLGNFFASAAAPQIYYVKAPQSNHAGVQYPTANALKIAYVPAPQPQHSVTYATAPTNSKVGTATQPHYQNYQLAYTHQPISYSAAAIAVPYSNNHQQQIVQIPNGYQLAAYSHQPVQISQPYSYVTSAPNEAGKAIVHGPNAAQASVAYHQQPQTFTFPTYQHLAAPINIPTAAKFVAFPTYSPTPSQYKSINAPHASVQPSATAATHSAHDGATSFASFSQQLNQRHHTAPTAIAPVKVLAQPRQQYYVTAPPPSSQVGYSSQKIAFQPITAAASSPQAYESPHNGVIHYGTHLYHPVLGKYGIGHVAPASPKLIYSH
ncbi:uncharacterized protein LOC119075892 [Bradysia coprophila]|uniref:uncharacterized protein LOC119075892 n=1 Tax=Bradysia coprophila TaxID=38358 RepID=UPI00187DC70E|nr:uncharacterized protein LOC119075892 [Bradysia coprophila]